MVDMQQEDISQMDCHLLDLKEEIIVSLCRICNILNNRINSVNNNLCNKLGQLINPKREAQ
jgi:hypothetical protein